MTGNTTTTKISGGAARAKAGSVGSGNAGQTNRESGATTTRTTGNPPSGPAGATTREG